MSESFLSSQSHKPLESESSHLNFFPVESESRLCRVTRTLESLAVIGLQARVNVESHEISRFLRHFFAMKWHPTYHKMAPDKLENGAHHAMKPTDKLENVAQCCFNKFDCRLFTSKFSQSTLNHFKKSSPTLLQVLQLLS